ncbi:hypothetical protein H8E77_29185 [bacterium]|nr:hypothetical protein [bacterium]
MNSLNKDIQRKVVISARVSTLTLVKRTLVFVAVIGVLIYQSQATNKQKVDVKIINML